nr:2988_t:CDS:10 [Entrophospora candida]
MAKETVKTVVPSEDTPNKDKQKLKEKNENKADAEKDKKDEELSEEDLQLKDELELLIERLKEENVDLHRPALESLRVHIRTSTSSMTSVPKPLKFLRPHYATITEIYLSWPESDNKHFLADILSVLAMTYDEGKRDSLKYRLEGSREEPGSWGHEYVRHLSTEIGQEFLYRQESDKPTEDLMNLALEIVPFLLKHNAEADAVDLFLELEAIDKLPQFVDKDTYPRVCRYMVSCVNLLVFPDDVSVLKTAHQIYCQHNKFTEAVSLAIRLGNEDLIKENFEAAGNFDPLLQKQIAFQLARQHITLPVDNEELLEIINNTHLSKHFIALAEELDVMEPKTPEDIYKSHLENIRPGYTSGNVDSARQNLASTFVNAFVNAGFCTDKLVSIEDGNAWLFKNKEQGMLSAAASIGLVTLWDVDAGLVCIDKYLYSKEDYIKAGALLAIGLFNTGVRNENDPAFALLSEHIESPNLNMRICAIVGLGMAYAGSHREDIQDILLPLVSDTNLSMEIASVAALSLGLIFVGNCNGDITSTILQTMMEREDSQLKEIWGRFMGLGLALLYLGKQDAAEVTLETLKAIEHPISKQVEVLVEICSYAGTGNVLKVQNMMHICDDHLDKEKDEDLHQAFAVLGVALIAMGEDIGAEMALRMFNHLMHYGEPVIRRTVPLALGLLCASNPLLNVLETLSKYSHDNDADVAINAIFAMGLVGAGTNNARLAQMLRQLASYYHKDANCLFMVRIAQGLLHMGKGTISINSFHSDRQLLSPVAIAGVLITLIAFTDTKTLILGKYHWFLYYLATAMYPRFLITLDENLNSLPVTVRVGQAVDVVGQAGRPKTITGFQTHSTPVLLAHSERAELATEECILYYFCCEDVNFVCYNYHNIITLTQNKSLDISLSHILEALRLHSKIIKQIAQFLESQLDRYNLCLVNKTWSPVAKSVLWSEPNFKTPDSLRFFLRAVKESRQCALRVQSLNLCAPEENITSDIFLPVLNSERQEHKIMSTYVISRPNFILNLNQNQLITHKAFYSSINYMHDLCVLDLDGDFNLSDGFAEILPTRCPMLASLKLSTKSMTEKGFDSLAKKFTKLTNLILQNCPHLIDENIESFVKKNPKLQKLQLLSKGLTIKTFQVVIYYAKELVYFDFRCLQEEISILPNEMQWLRPVCHNLDTLILENLPIDDHIISTIVIHCKKMKNIGLSKCSNITDDSINSIASNQKKLCLINLVECRNITDLSLKYLDSCGSFAPEAIHWFVNVSPKLEKIILHGMPSIINSFIYQFSAEYQQKKQQNGIYNSIDAKAKCTLIKLSLELGLPTNVIDHTKHTFITTATATATTSSIPASAQHRHDSWTTVIKKTRSCWSSINIKLPKVGNDKQVNNELKSTTIKGYKSSWNKPVGGEDDLGGWADFGIQSSRHDYNNKDKDAVVVDSHQQNISKLFISPDSINNDCDVNDDKEILVDIGTWDKPGSVIDMIWDSSATEQSNSDNTIEVEEEEESIKKRWGTPPESAIAWNDPRQGEKVQRQHQKEESCHKEACAIQACLQKNNYQESKCQESINQLYQCCEKLLKSGGESASCSKKIMKNKDFL